VVTERKLNTEQAAKVHMLIDRLTERPRSRMVGEDHINLLRLNLALDALQ
jgi:K+-transporting ATPase c subunit